MSKIKTVGIVGTGVIGTGWIIRNLAHNKIVHAYDQNKNLKNYVLKEIKRTSKSIKKLFGKKILIKNLKFFNSLEKALSNVDFVQESVLENYKVKTDLIQKISKYVKSNVTSSVCLQCALHLGGHCHDLKTLSRFNTISGVPAVEASIVAI